MLLLSATGFGSRYRPVSVLSTGLFPALGGPELNIKKYGKEQARVFTCFLPLSLLLETYHISY